MLRGLSGRTGVGAIELGGFTRRCALQCDWQTTNYRIRSTSTPHPSHYALVQFTSR